MTKTITALTVQARNTNRVNVFLDGDYAFALDVMAAARLHRGQTLTAEEVAALVAEEEQTSAYHQALRHLGGRPHSRAEIQRHLISKRFSSEAIDSAIERLQRDGLVDDAEFARFWTENRVEFRPRSTRALRYELRQKGVDGADIDAALVEVDDEHSAWAAVQSKLALWQKLPPEEFEKKLFGFLARRGFDFDTARGVLRKAKADLADDA
jgi:regulatory protein